MEKKKETLSELRKRVGMTGGKASLKKMLPEDRIERARKAAAARWGKKAERQ